MGSGKIFPDAQTVITQPKDGEFKAFSAVCTHQGCIGGHRHRHDQLRLPRQQVLDHRRFGCQSSGTQPLPPKTIKVDGDTLTVSVGQLGGSGPSKGNHLVESRQSTAHEGLRAHAP